MDRSKYSVFFLLQKQRPLFPTFTVGIQDEFIYFVGLNGFHRLLGQ